MFYSIIFLTFDRDAMYRNECYNFNFLERKISLTSKMFNSLETPVSVHVIFIFSVPNVTVPVMNLDFSQKTRSVMVPKKTGLGLN